ncbi:hypothetical protein LUZ61_015667 [Rhynchospora tenuis]|uniref:Dolichyl-diphosphooligosaccharide-protein glycosyltransferase subunit OST5 n=1 Tax=Rhynchospora tenuis TaxID=198213 RepID=A0AAD5Z429_9POAL|nr:hypothetical protein LUZ61_015667 [Rhynchospora tenuis]
MTPSPPKARTPYAPNPNPRGQAPSPNPIGHCCLSAPALKAGRCHGQLMHSVYNFPKTSVRTSEIRRASLSLSLSLLDRILMALKSISSPVPVALYPTLAVVMLSVGFMTTAFFFIYEATSTRKSRSLTKELAISLFASVFLGFGSLFLLLASGVYV